MHLILKRVSENIGVSDIKVFLEPAVKGGLFKKSGSIDSIKIQMVLEIGSTKAEYHVLVVINPDAVGQRVIKALNRKSCNGKPINIAEYFLRHFTNDRRQDNNQIFVNRRKSDRRRKNLQIKDITDASKKHEIEFSDNLSSVKEINWY